MTFEVGGTGRRRSQSIEVGFLFLISKVEIPVLSYETLIAVLDQGNIDNILFISNMEI